MKLVDFDYHGGKLARGCSLIDAAFFFFFSIFPSYLLLPGSSCTAALKEKKSLGEIFGKLDC